MSKNYLFQNYGYVENPVNMKHVVIDLLRGHGIFIHMRDEPSGIYDENKFLYEKNEMGIPYHEDNIKTFKYRIKKAEDILLKLKSEEADSLYEEYLKDYKRHYDESVSTNRAYNRLKDRASKVQDRINIIKNFNEKFSANNILNQDLTNLIKKDLSDCIEALEEDYDGFIRRAVEADVTGTEEENFNPMGKEEWVSNQINRYKEELTLLRKRIKDEKEAIKNLRAKDEIIKALFKELDAFDEEND